MGLLSTLKQKITGTPKEQTLSTPVYMESGAQFVCKDHINKANKIMAIVAKHVNNDIEDFPGFQVYKTSSRDGMIGMNRQLILNLDTDSDPTEGSKNLLTSGTVFNVVMALQTQIDELKAKLEK